MRRTLLGAVLILAAGGGFGGAATARVRAADTAALALDRVLSPAVQPLDVSLPAIEPGQPIPDVYTGFGKDVSPAVAWSGAPPGTLAYVVIMQDADTPDRPRVHWLAYNIPATATGLSKNVRNRAEPHSPAGTLQGMNDAGGIGYVGPKPPPGDAHHYHVQVFALDRPLALKARANLDQLLAAMDNRVMADGEAVATFAAPGPKPEPKASEPARPAPGG